MGKYNIYFIQCYLLPSIKTGKKGNIKFGGVYTTRYRKTSSHSV